MQKRKIFQVSEFNEFISVYLEQVGEVVVEGELSQIRVNQGKWVFATVKDKEASVDVFGLVFKIGGYDLLEPGMLVHVTGRPRLYAKTGRFSLFAKKITPAGEGALGIIFEKLKEKLGKDGLFNPERKRQIPEFPQRIGLITAPDSRAYGDFIKVLKHRMGGLKIFFYPVNVQGENSVESIVRAFSYFNKKKPGLEAIALIRGGGSLEDLKSFNDEKMARAIFSSRAPVVCGVGHEDDLSIADLVADLRASTPSNAAELMVRDRAEVLGQVNYQVKTMDTQLENIIKKDNLRLAGSIQLLGNQIARQAETAHRVIVRFFYQFFFLKKSLENFKRALASDQEKLYQVVDFWLENKKNKLENLTRLLKSFNVLKTLRRGFSVTFDHRGKVLKNSLMVRKGGKIKTILFSGRITSEILDVARK
ncbi:MAG: exodeoxyribonuclease VII large subunit [Candidatus Pacebacteria bacterium]|nr:exodeoxyribonuclease VII large subunit [Candidatus Paceibacterota bacterium]